MGKPITTYTYIPEVLHFRILSGNLDFSDTQDTHLQRASIK